MFSEAEASFDRARSAFRCEGNNNIQGIQVDKEEIKLEMFADDVTAFVRNRRSLEALLCSTDLFSKCSGLEINSEKTECMLWVLRKLRPSKTKT